MYLKPPRSRRGRSLVGLAAAAVTLLGFAGAGLATAEPALADPVNNYVGVGSNTTQDVIDAFAAVLGDGTIGSYDAWTPITATSYNTSPADDVEISPEKEPFGISNSSGSTTKCDFTRPNGSGAGIAALEYTINPDFTNTNLPPAPNSGTQEPGYDCIDFARSSSAPSTNADGDLLYIPFALDALADATGPPTGGTTTINGTSVTYLPTAITAAGGFSETDLKTLYSCTDTLTQGTTDYTTVTVPDGDTYGEAGSTTYYVRTSSITTPPTSEPDAIPVDLEVPQSGSGTRTTWLTDLTGSTTLPACVNQVIVNASAGNTSFDGDAVEENDGTVYTVDPNALGPFSVAQVIAQSSGYGTYRLFGATVQDMATAGAPTTAIGPYTGTLGTNAKINPLYPIVRLMYIVVLAGRILGTPGAGGTNGTVQYLDGNNNEDGTYDAGLAALFSGSGSALCSDSVLIGHYGFATLPQDTQAGETVDCGDTSSVELAVPDLTAGLPSGYPAPY